MSAVHRLISPHGAKRLPSPARATLALGLALLAGCGSGSSHEPVDLGELHDPETIPLGAFTYPVDELSYDFSSELQVQYWHRETWAGDAHVELFWDGELGRNNPANPDDDGTLIVAPTWVGESDQFAVFTDFEQEVLGLPEDAIDRVDLTCATVRASVWLPDDYVDDGQMGIKLFTEDGSENYASLGWNATADMEGGRWNEIVVQTITDDSFDYQDGGYDLSDVRILGVEFNANGKPVDVAGDIRVDNILINPSVIQDCVEGGQFELQDLVANYFAEAAELDDYYEDWLAGDLSYELTWDAEAGQDGTGALRFAFNWANSAADELLYGRNFEALDLTGKTVRAEFYVPQAYVDDGNMGIKVYVKDSNFRYGSLGWYQTSNMDGDAWNTIEVADIVNDNPPFDYRDDGFDATDVDMVGVQFVSNGKPTGVSGDILVDSVRIAELVETQGGRNFALNYDFADPAQLDDWGYDWAAGGLTEDNVNVYHSDAQGEGALAFDIPWANASSDEVMWAAVPDEPIDLTDAVVRASVYVPQAYVDDGNMGIKLYTKDAGWVYGSLGWNGAASLNGDAWNTIEVSVTGMDAFDYHDEGYDLTQVQMLGVQFVSNGKPASVGGTLYVDDFQVILPGAPESDALLRDDFTTSDQLAQWSFDWADGSLAAGSVDVTHTADHDGAMAFDIPWGASNDELLWARNLDEPLDLSGTVVRMDVYMPQAYVDDANMGVKIYTKDTDWIYGSLGWYGLAEFNGDDWTTIEVLVDGMGAFDYADEGYDMTQVNMMGVQFVANGKPAEVDGTIYVRRFEVISP